MKYKYAVFGLGRQGVAAVYDLIQNCSAERVLVCDIDKDKLKNIKYKLKNLCDTSRILPFNSYGEIWDVINPKNVDVILGCAPYNTNMDLTYKSIEKGVPFCDLGGNPEVVSGQKSLAINQEISIIPDCGLAPGITNIISGYFIKEFGDKNIIIRCGGLPVDIESNYINYKFSFSADGLISEYNGQCAYIHDGNIMHARACTGLESFGDKYECFFTSNHSYESIKSLLNLGVNNFVYKTIRYKGHLDRIIGWKELGYLHMNLIKDKNLVKLLEENNNLKYADDESDMILLTITGSHYENNNNLLHQHIYDIKLEGNKEFKAMELMTSWGITLVAYYMAVFKDQPSGFVMPSDLARGSWFIDEINKRIKQIEK